MCGRYDKKEFEEIFNKCVCQDYGFMYVNVLKKKIYKNFDEVVGSHKLELGNKKLSKKDTRGWKINSLLQPKVLPTGKVAISSVEIPANTIFTGITVTHIADTFGRDWFSSIEVKE